MAQESRLLHECSSTYGANLFRPSADADGGVPEELTVAAIFPELPVGEIIVNEVVLLFTDNLLSPLNPKITLVGWALNSYLLLEGLG
jgi:hypothetical protein